MSVERIALDIETIPICDDPDFSNPTDWVPFCIALGHDPGDGEDIEVDVVFRSGPSLDSEREMLSSTLDWIGTRMCEETTVLITYNGENYDIPVLTHRCRGIDTCLEDTRLTDRLQLVLADSHHVDLIERMRRQEGRFVSLDSALEIHGIESDTPTWNGDPVDGSDMPVMGKALVSPEIVTDGLRGAVRRYATSDVRPLFKLDDCLREIDPV